MASASKFEHRAPHGLEIFIQVLSGYSTRTPNPAFVVQFEADPSVYMCVHSSGKLCITCSPVIFSVIGSISLLESVELISRFIVAFSMFLLGGGILE